jgi:transcriptional regulator with XRE-family HTH domain
MADDVKKLTESGRPQEEAEAGSSLGMVIRQARTRAHLTLVRVAERTGLSVSYLSQVERDRLTPSVSALKRIGDALEIPAGTLMFGLDSRRPGAKIGVVRRGARKSVAFPDSRIRYEMLTPDLRRRTSLLWLSAPPGAQSGGPFAHEGEDVVVVLNGNLRVEVGGVWYELHAGDSITFASELPHRWSNSGSQPCEAIWVSTPPSF